MTIVWLAKWIRESITDSRVVIVTDRIELDEQIEKVFKGVDESIYRTKSGADLVGVLSRHDERLICSLIHKFGSSAEGDIDAFNADVEKHLPKDFKPKGEIFVFVDECHRSQSAKLHKAMKAILPDATFIGFHWDAAPQERQAEERRDLRPLRPHLRVRRGPCVTASSSTCATRLATSTNS